MKIDWASKLSSRKFWALVAALVIATAVIFTSGATEVTITGAVMALGSIVAFIFGESWVDASRESSNTTSASVSGGSAQAIVASAQGTTAQEKKEE